MSYNSDALIFEAQVVVSNNTQPAGSTTGSIVNEGTLSTKDTFITGQTVINNVNITPNTNDIIYERQATLVNNRNSYTDIPDFTFDSAYVTSFKAIINVTVSTGEASNAVWEINGLYKPSGWVITSSFTGDITGVFFSMRDDAGIGKIQYTNSNTSGSTIVRFRATTTAPPGTTPEGVPDGVGVGFSTTGNYIQNSLIYANGTNSLASTDITYNSNVFSIGGASRIVAERATSFVSYSNGGAITSMGDASIAKKLIVGDKIGIATTAPGYTLDINGDLNFNGSLYQNGAAYKSSQWTTTAGNDISYTSGSVLTTNMTTGNLNFTGDIYKNGVLYSGSAWITGTDGSLSYTSGSLVANNFSAQNAVFTNSSLGSATINDFVNLRTDNLSLGVSNMYSGSFTANNNVSSSENIVGLAFDNATIRSFNATVTITVLKSTNQNLYESYTLDGFQTGSAWNLYTSHIGDNSGVLFSITNNGQVKYTSIDHTVDWISTTLRFNVSTINNQEGYSQVDFNTAGTYTVAGITAGNINFTGSLYQNGSPFLGTSQWNNTIGGGISFTSGSVVVRNLNNTNISSSSLNVTGITAGSINFTADIYKNGVPYSSSQWLTTAGNISYTSGTVNAVGVVATNMTTGSLRANATVSAGTLAATNSAITNITASTLRVTNSTFSSALISNITSSNINVTNLNGTNVNTTNVTTSTLLASNVNATTLTTSSLFSTSISTGTLQAPNGITVGNINFTGSLYQNGVAYLGSQWTTTSGNVSYTSGSVVATDVNATTLTAGTLVSSNANATTLTAGTLVSSNANVTNLTAANVLFGTVSSSFIASNVITGGSLSLSGDLIVGGTLTTVNITTTNLTDINISTGTLNASSSTISNVLFTNISSSSVIVSNANATTLSAGTLVASNANATTLTAGTLVASNANATTLTAGTLVASNANATTLTAGTLVASNANATTLTAGTLVASNVNITTLSTGTLVSYNAILSDLTNGNFINTTMSSGTIIVSNANAVTLTAGTLVSSNANATTLSAGTLINTTMSTGTLAASNANATTLTASTLVSSNANVTTLTAGTLVASNANVTTLTAGNLVATTGLTSASASITDGLFTNITVSNSITNVSNTTTSFNINSYNTRLYGGLAVNYNGMYPPVGGQIAISPSNNFQEGSIKFWTGVGGSGTFWNIGHNSGEVGLDNIGFFSNTYSYNTSTNAAIMSITSLGRVGILTTSPSYPLDVNGNANVSGKLSSVNITTTNLTTSTLIVSNANATTLTAGTFVNTTMSSGTLIASNANVTTLTAGTLFANNITSSSFVLSSSYTNGSYSLSITNGNVYFKNPQSGYIWYENNTVANMQLTNGNLSVTGDITGFGNLSDIRLKTNIIDIAQSQSLEVVNSLRPVTFNWKDDIFNESKRGTADAGFIAQEVEEVIPYAVSDYITSDASYKHIKYERILPYLVGSIQKLTNENNELRNRLSEIEKTL